MFGIGHVLLVANRLCEREPLQGLRLRRAGEGELVEPKEPRGQSRRWQNVAVGTMRTEDGSAVTWKSRNFSPRNQEFNPGSWCPLLSCMHPWTVVESKGGQWVFWNELTRAFPISIMQHLMWLFYVAFCPLKVSLQRRTKLLAC